LLRPVADAILYTTSIFAVYLWFGDMTVIEETKCSAPRYKLMYLRQVVLVSCSGKATRPERCTYTTLQQRFSSLYLWSMDITSLCHGEDAVAGGPCIPGSVILLCSDELKCRRPWNAWYEQSIKQANVCERTPLVLEPKAVSQTKAVLQWQKQGSTKRDRSRENHESPVVSTCLDMRKGKAHRVLIVKEIAFSFFWSS
jgi:hypothetical protein